MVDPVTTPSDDLSGGTATNLANESLLDDAKARRWLRIVAAVLVGVVIAGLGYLLCITVRALLADLAFITIPAVTFVAALVLAVAGLSIALLRSVFTDHGPQSKPDADDPLITAPGIEVLKTIYEMAGSAIKGGKP